LGIMDALSRVRIEIDLDLVAIGIGAEVVREWLRDELPHDGDLVSLHAIVQLTARGG
jgi:hypothetical protein